MWRHAIQIVILTKYIMSIYVTNPYTYHDKFASIIFVFYLVIWVNTILSIFIAYILIVAYLHSLQACPAPNHYLNQCWLIVNYTLRNKLQWNLHQNSKFFNEVNAFENVVCNFPAKFSMGRWVGVQMTAMTGSLRHLSLIDTRGPFYQHGLTLILAWIGNYIHYKVWDEITYPFLNFNGWTIEV